MPRYKKGIRNNCFHQNYTHDVLFPGATFRTRHNGECEPPRVSWRVFYL